MNPALNNVRIAAILFAVLSFASCTKNKEAETAKRNTTDTLSLPPPNPEKNCYFGDLHLHTALSADATMIGADLFPEDAYKFAMGQEVVYMGERVKRIAPLDFLAVTDHAEYLGILLEARNPDGPLTNTNMYKLLSSGNQEDIAQSFLDFSKSIATNKPIQELMRPEVIKSSWQRIIDAAEAHNQPGKFTTFIGFEWTSAPATSTNAQQNLHRCVIFEGNEVPDLPLSSFDSQDPEVLWTYLENARQSGSDVLAVPHNGNVSNGLMFSTRTFSGEPITKEYATRRMQNEPLVEIMQGKGQSETKPALSPTDEFANYELVEVLLGSQTPADDATGSYIRQAYGVGQELQEKIGVNPFQYGIEAGTDFHSGISTTEENNYPGSHVTQDNLRKDYEEILKQTSSFNGEPAVKLAAAGLTGVWAEQNTREAIFSAFKRKETFGTSGPRIRVRMFAGWNYAENFADDPEWVKTAYMNGVPMGGNLAAGQGKPRFIVHALKDPNSANLDRIQIIKIATKNGKSEETIHDVVWSGERTPDARGKLPPVGNTVDLEAGTYTNTIGSTELTGYWVDEHFDPASYTTYYARVLEIPTPRWSTMLAAKHKLPLSKVVDPVQIERAWTSPIWYVPDVGE